MKFRLPDSDGLDPLGYDDDRRERLELIGAIVYGGLLIAVAILVRAGLLWLLAQIGSPGTRNWAIVFLEFVSDVGMVFAAGAYTLVDIARHLVLVVRSFRVLWGQPVRRRWYE